MRKENAAWVKSYAEASGEDFYPEFNAYDAMDKIADEFQKSARIEAERLVAEALTDALGDIFLMEGLTKDGHLVMSVCTGDAYRVDFDIEQELLASLNGLDWNKADCLTLAQSLRRVADAAEKAAETAPDE